MTTPQIALKPETQIRLRIERFREQQKREKAVTNPIWKPNPNYPDGRINPQRMAYESEADVVGFGGGGGSGKTDLVLGLAATRQRKCIVFRSKFKNFAGMIERSRQIFNPKNDSHSQDTYNESLHRWQLDNGRLLEFQVMEHEKDKFNFRGRDRDFMAFDEVTELSRTQVEFVMAWNRSAYPGQRCRVLMTFNPPTDEQGNWVVDYFLPWIAYLFPHKFNHPNPAAPGELRWYATVKGVEKEFPNGDEVVVEGESRPVRPRSRTFIPATLQDNPHLGSDYESVLQSLPEPLRSQMLLGDFAASAMANPYQVIPTEWVRMAQQRWLERERPLTPLTSVGVDVARGGADKTAISKRYDNWFDVVITYPGVVTYDGPIVADKVIQALLKEDGTSEEPLCINLDAIGVGSSPEDYLKDKYTQLNPVNVGVGSEYRDKSGKYKMKNLRSEIYWRMRDALDPANGHDVCLPPGSELVADLCSATYKPTVSGIQVELKSEIKKRIGRSPDIGEAVLLANYFKENWWYWE